ncbi:MAG: AAA family ATPase [Rhodobiaceae bacterium]|nr:AAA family ATPase [Rhodobiaceae bacterium]
MGDGETTLERYVLSGCSGGGKSTLLTELGRRGYRTVSEPGREIVREELEKGGDALPWINPQAFADRAIEMSVGAFDEVASHRGSVFFDRSFIDAVSSVVHQTGALSPDHTQLVHQRRYAPMVFLVPPWPEIFVTDAERQTGYEEAVAEYERLLVSFELFGYKAVIMPKEPVEKRADFVLAAIGIS